MERQGLLLLGQVDGLEALVAEMGGQSLLQHQVPSVNNVGGPAHRLVAVQAGIGIGWHCQGIAISANDIAANGMIGRPSSGGMATADSQRQRFDPPWHQLHPGKLPAFRTHER